jgi:hypothetical protein
VDDADDDDDDNDNDDDNDDDVMQPARVIDLGANFCLEQMFWSRRTRASQIGILD